MAAGQLVQPIIKASPRAGSSALSLMQKYLKYPTEMLIDDKIPVRISKFRMSQFDEGYQLYKQAFDRGDGFTAFDVEKSAFRHKLEKSQDNILCMTHANTGTILCVMPMIDSVLCRSNRSMLGTSYTVVHPDYTGKGIARSMYGIAWRYSIGLGYFGFNSRVAVTTRNIVPVLAVGGQITGVIPKSALLGSYGYVDDLVIFRSYELHNKYPEYYKMSMKARSIIPKLTYSKENIGHLHTETEVISTELLLNHGKRIKIRQASKPDDLWKTEEIIQQGAINGEGFALDEFMEDGTFNRKFLRYSTVLVVENANQIVGAAIFGPSNLSRAMKPIVAHCYIAVDKSHQGQGIGQSLLNHLMKVIQQQGFEHCLMDTFVNNFKTLRLMNKNGFSSRGAMPYCACVKKYGPMESLIFHKQLK